MKKEEVLKSAIDWFKGDDLRANVWVDKYCLRNDTGEYIEKDPDDMFKRIASEFARIEFKYPKPLSYDEIYDLFKDFKYIIPGGSMLYGIGNSYSYSSLGNCFCIGDSTDSYGSICKIDEEQVQLMKRRGGVGHDLSHLRPKGSPVTNAAGSSTGPVSFMPRYSNSTREVGQDGRRGALMLTMDINHLDVEDFITAKDDLTKVTGANISVKITDAFMECVEADEGYRPWFRTPAGITYYDSINAKNLWDKIIHQAWKSAEPGVLFWDTIINNSPADKYSEFKSISTNPCGEIPLCAYDTCRLMSINLFSFVEKPFTSEAYFDMVKFINVVTKAQRLMDDVIDLEAEKIDAILNKVTREHRVSDVEVDLWVKIKNKLLRGRRTGLSAIGLADCLAALGLQYGSEESLVFCNLKYKLFHDVAYESSCEMARERGAFPAFYRGCDNAKIDNVIIPFEDKERRNIALLTIPPSGSIAILAGIASGIEPVFNLEYTRRRKVEESDNIVFIDKNGDKWEEYTIYHPKYEEYGKPEIYINSVAHKIDPFKRVELQATIQQWIDHSISSTINLPKETTEEEIDRIYRYAWKKGCKGITVYREGCREGVLINKPMVEEFKQHSAPKRPKELRVDIKTVIIKGKKYAVLIGLLNSKPYEVFVLDGDKSYSNPKETFMYTAIVKESSGKYYLNTRNDESDYVTEHITDEQAAITRLVSTALRHGTDIKFIVEQLNKTHGDLTSFNKAIARTLKQYMINGSHLKGSTCEVCGSKLIIQNGCESCTCGYVKCS